MRYIFTGNISTVGVFVQSTYIHICIYTYTRVYACMYICVCAYLCLPSLCVPALCGFWA